MKKNKMLHDISVKMIHDGCTEQRNINRNKMTGRQKLTLLFILLIQLGIILYFCNEKQGFHYDEYYSYYSSNVTYGLVPSDREWKDVGEITSEFIVMEDSKFQYPMVTVMQSYDVHPPLYYWILHTVCSIFDGEFSKWTGLGINIGCFIIAYWLTAYIANRIFGEKFGLMAMSCLLFGCSAGVISSIVFIRMYMLLLVWCLLFTCVHVKGLFLTKKKVISFYLPIFIISCLGFLTHYYFAVFVFFMAAFSCFWLLFNHKSLKQPIVYGMTVVGGMAAAIIIYPSCLSHIFRGYRGTEATDAFFSIENTVGRLRFFTGLLNEFVFNGLMWYLMGAIGMLILISIYFLGKEQEKKEIICNFLKKNQEILLIGFTALGYFLAVTKTALLNAEEAIRYQLPIFGIAILFAVATLYVFMEYVSKCRQNLSEDRENSNKNMKWKQKYNLYIIYIILGMMCISGWYGLCHGQVQFLYQKDREHVEWAEARGEECVAYLYNPANSWMIWDESEELMQYDEIYFVNAQDMSEIVDDKINTADTVYMYTSRVDGREDMLAEIVKSNENLEGYELIRELLYCDLYELK